jgi:hypothetical protein
MGLFTAITGLFKRSSDATKEDQVNEFQNVSISGGTSLVNTSTTSTNTPTPVFTSSTPNFMDTHTTASTNVDISMEEGCACGGSCTCQEKLEEEVCACGGSCTCQGDPEEESIDSSVVVQATFPGIDDLPIGTKPEIEPPIKVHKIEDASTIIRPAEKVKQLGLPGFEEASIVSPKAKKRSNTRKSSAKLTRKSTAKRKK